MTVKELNCIYSSLWNVKEIMQNVACENYPYTEFADEEISNMYYALNDMCITIREKTEKLEKENEQ